MILNVGRRYRRCPSSGQDDGLAVTPGLGAVETCGAAELETHGHIKEIGTERFSGVGAGPENMLRYILAVDMTGTARGQHLRPKLKVLFGESSVSANRPSQRSSHLAITSELREFGIFCSVRWSGGNLREVRTSVSRCIQGSIHSPPAWPNLAGLEHEGW